MLNEFYKRQIQMSEVGVEGQKKISNSNVLIIGAGALGSPLAIYLAGCGIGNITIIDNDRIELTNLHRQILYTPADCGEYKANVLKKRLDNYNPYIKINATNKRYTSEDEHIIKSYDYIIDCTDNFSSQFLIHDHCYKHKKNFLTASIHKFEGIIHRFNFDESCFRCLYPQKPNGEIIKDCADVGIMAPVAGIIGTIMASEIVNSILELSPDASESITFNSQTYQTNRISWTQSPSCPTCGRGIPQTNLFEVDKLSNSILINLNEHFDIDDFIENIDSRNNYLFTCEKGYKSYRTVLQLRSEGLNNCFSLKGGIGAIS
jgi:adenylyltransferase/sulfurtransferase